MSWFSGVLLAEHGYRPRHSSARRARIDVGGLDEPWLESASERDCTTAGNAWHEHPALNQGNGTYDALDQMTFSEIRRVLEGCAIDDPTTVVPELVQLIAHSSHTPDSLEQAWSEFEEATRDVYALRLRMRNWSALVEPDAPDDNAIALMRRYADSAWQLITRGSSQAPAAAAAAR